MRSGRSRIRFGAESWSGWRGARRRMSTDTFKSVYSIFVSRLDVYTEKAVRGSSIRPVTGADLIAGPP